MKTNGISLLAAAACLTGFARLGAQIPAFPGAEGAGAYATGGRGGDVYHVTNTNPAGPGSFADAVTNHVPSKGRTVVFDVSGYAHISKLLRVHSSKITIAGQTAPGDGFGLKDGTFWVSGSDCIILDMRFRDGRSADSIDLDRNSSNCIFDHCDALFSHDENMSTFKSAPENLTYQWGFNAWGMESHSAGGLWDMNHVTCSHSLWAHNHTRNPKARAVLLDWIDNVTFDWDIGYIMADSQSPGGWYNNVEGNYFIAGTPGKSKALEKGGKDRNGNWNFHVYLANNRFDGNANHVLDGIDTGYRMVSGDVEHLTAPAPNNGIPVQADDPLLSYKKILSAAGPLRTSYEPAMPLRDEVADLLIAETIAQTHHHIHRVEDTGLPNGGFGNLNSAPAPLDTDHDGIPDYFESAVSGGTSGPECWDSAKADNNTPVPNTATANAPGIVSEPTFFPPNTPAGISRKDQYTHLEEYLYFLSIPHAVMPESTTANPKHLVINLSKFTRGFSKGAQFRVSGAVNGEVGNVNDLDPWVLFAPEYGLHGRAKFNFTVTDEDGSTWTQPFAVLVTPDGDSAH